jgi:outer membrane protein TolC
MTSTTSLLKRARAGLQAALGSSLVALALGAANPLPIVPSVLVALLEKSASAAPLSEGREVSAQPQVEPVQQDGVLTSPPEKSPASSSSGAATESGPGPAADPPQPDPGLKQALPESAFATSLLSVTRQDESGHLAFVIRANGRVRYHDFVLGSPDRLVVDFSDVTTGMGLRSLDVLQGPIRRVRIAQFSVGPPKMARIVFDLNRPTPYHVVEESDGIHVIFDEDDESLTRLGPPTRPSPAAEAKEATERSEPGSAGSVPPAQAPSGSESVARLNPEPVPSPSAPVNPPASAEPTPATAAPASEVKEATERSEPGSASSVPPAQAPPGSESAARLNPEPVPSPSAPVNPPASAEPTPATAAPTSEAKEATERSEAGTAGSVAPAQASSGSESVARLNPEPVPSPSAPVNPPATVEPAPATAAATPEVKVATERPEPGSAGAVPPAQAPSGSEFVARPNPEPVPSPSAPVNPPASAEPTAATAAAPQPASEAKEPTERPVPAREGAAPEPRVFGAVPPPQSGASAPQTKTELTGPSPSAQAIPPSPSFGPLDLNGCIAVALSRHPLVEGGMAQLAAAQATVGTRSAERRPSGTFDGQGGYLRGTPTSPFVFLGGRGLNGEVALFVDGSYTQAQATVEVPVITHGALSLKTSHYIREAQIQTKQREEENVGLRRELATGVVDAYFRVLEYRGQISPLQRLVAARETDVKITGAELKEKLISPNDALIAEVHLASARHDLDYARLLLRRSQQDLARAMGLPMSTDVPVQEVPEASAPAPNLEELLHRLAESPTLKAIEFSALAKHEEGLSIQKEKFPAASLFARYSAITDFQAGLPKPYLDYGTVFLNVTWKAFDWGAVHQKAAVAFAEEKVERSKLQNEKLVLEEQLREVYNRLQELDTNATLIEKQVQQATEGVKLEEAMFHQGLVLETVYDEALAGLLQLQVARNNNDYDRQMARAELRVLNGEWDGPPAGLRSGN